MDNGARSYRRFLDGDETAVNEIMEELFLPLVFFVNRYVRDVHAAEDIALDAMADLFVYRRGYNFKASLKTYLFMIGKSRAVDMLRRRRTSATAGLAEAETVPDDLASLEEAVLTDERRRAVNEAIRQLPSEDMQAAVHLVYFEELTYEEAARVMKKSRKQVDNLLYRAKKHLAGLLKKENEE